MPLFRQQSETVKRLENTGHVRSLRSHFEQEQACKAPSPTLESVPQPQSFYIGQGDDDDDDDEVDDQAKFSIPSRWCIATVDDLDACDLFDDTASDVSADYGCWSGCTSSPSAAAEHAARRIQSCYRKSIAWHQQRTAGQREACQRGADRQRRAVAVAIQSAEQVAAQNRQKLARQRAGGVLSQRELAIIAAAQQQQVRMARRT